MASPRKLPTREDPLPEDIYGEVVHVKVGQDLATNYNLDKGLVSYYSGYFQPAINGDFAEGKSGVIELPTEDPIVFKRFINWLYSQKIQIPGKACSGIPSESYKEICQLWTFGDRREIPLLMNERVDAVRDHLVKVWIHPAFTIPEVYEHSAPGSLLRRLIMHLLVSVAEPENVLSESQRKCFSWEALLDLSKLLWQKLKEAKGKFRRLSKGEIERIDMCPFHVHEEGVECRT